MKIDQILVNQDGLVIFTTINYNLYGNMLKFHFHLYMALYMYKYVG